MQITPLSQRFISHFGEMGSHWGFNRTVGQMYALLYLSPEPLNADTIAELLQFSRSNVSMGLKELQSWRLVKLSHIAGDRREYFSSLADVWEIFKVIAAERHRREVAPTGTVLRDLLLSQAANADEIYAQERMRDMYQLVEQVNAVTEQLQHLSPESMEGLMKMAMKMNRLLEWKEKIMPNKAATAAEE